ncbi:PilZ domain-containing protein [Holophaga foetida]|uniref:PilZ domain-containing protein n=1 Tax=Holophaga foetida TaxID=35839 RepID=UPI0002474D9E|nr:PilZ domain-containing protein [Holophaga foetida]
MDQGFSQREFTRVPTSLDVRVTVGGRAIPNTGSQNVSLKGMLIHTQEALPKGTVCNLSILLAGGEIEVEIEGVVVNNYPEGTAFQFNKILGVDSFEHLRNLVLYNAQDTEQVEDEFRTHIGLKKKAE